MENSQESGAYDSQTSLWGSQVDNSQTIPRNVVTLPLRQDHNTHTGTMISQIEAIFESMVDSIDADANHISIPYRSRTRSRGSVALDTGALRFPGRTPQEAKKFSMLNYMIVLLVPLLTSWLSVLYSLSTAYLANMPRSTGHRFDDHKEVCLVLLA